MDRPVRVDRSNVIRADGRKYFLFVRRRPQLMLADLDTIALHEHGVAFDRLVVHVMAGRVLLPEEATDEGAAMLARTDPTTPDSRAIPNTRRAPS